jgi:hypothetical protein
MAIFASFHLFSGICDFFEKNPQVFFRAAVTGSDTGESPSKIPEIFLQTSLKFPKMLP